MTDLGRNVHEFIDDPTTHQPVLRPELDPSLPSPSLPLSTQAAMVSLQPTNLLYVVCVPILLVLDFLETS